MIERLAGDVLQQHELGLLGDNGNRLEDRPCPAAEPRRAGEHRIANRRRNSRLTGSEHLGDEERVACCPAVEFAAFDAARLGERRDGLSRERQQVHTVHGRAPRQLPDCDPQRVGEIELIVSIADENERRKGFDSPSE
jgi:hypothetical protein